MRRPSSKTAVSQVGLVSSATPMLSGLSCLTRALAMRVLPQSDSPVSHRGDEGGPQPREQFAGVPGVVEVARGGGLLEGLFLQSPKGFLHMWCPCGTGCAGCPRLKSGGPGRSRSVRSRRVTPDLSSLRYRQKSPRRLDFGRPSNYLLSRSHGGALRCCAQTFYPRSPDIGNHTRPRWRLRPSS